MANSFRSGFIYLLGRPNVGKSTLFNQLVGKKLAIATPKQQTTRQELIGIRQYPNHQLIYVDTPGFLTPTYLLQERMLQIFYRSLRSSDILLWVVDLSTALMDEELSQFFKKVAKPLFILLNKLDLCSPQQVKEEYNQYQQNFPAAKIFPLSAHSQQQIAQLTEEIKRALPTHAPYYGPNSTTDKSLDFFAAEFIRQQVLLLYHQEIPYHTFVVITHFEKRKEQIRLKADLYVGKKGQQRVIIGHKGRAIQQLSERSRKALTEFFKQPVFLVIEVKVATNWRKDPKLLHQWGYH